jgi:hypothetical protein
VLETATSETFVPHVGTTFEATTQAGDTIALVLTSCDVDSSSGPAPGGRIPFSLLFHDADASRYAAQQTFSMSHEDLGEFPLFLVPRGPDQHGMGYQAIFS